MASDKTLLKRAVVPSLLILAFSASLLLNGCFKYTFSTGGPSHIKTIAIPLFKNSTAEFGVVEKITDELIQTFQNDNTLTVTEEGSADAVLWGTLSRVEDIPYTYGEEGQSSNFTVGEYKLTLYVDLEYYDLVKDETIWKQQVSGWGTYDHSAGSPDLRDQGIQEAIDKLSQDILNKTFSTW